MPKRVDHEARKRQIAEALLRVVRIKGLHAVGMRDVAAAAGVSVRLVQYYFTTKEHLLLYGLKHLGELFGKRVEARLNSIGPKPGPRAIIQTVLEESLPTDDESRILHHAYTAYHVLALTDAKLAAQPFLEGPNAIEAYLVEQLRLALPERAQRRAYLRAEVVGLLAISAGLGTGILAGQRSVADGRRILRYHVNRLFQLVDQDA